MLRSVRLGVLALGLVAIACGSDSDDGGSGGGSSTGGSGNASSGGLGNSSSGGSGGSGTGGTAGSSSGGASTGGTAGASTGGAAGSSSGGTAGASPNDKAFGESCANEAECSSGFCENFAGEKLCTEPCNPVDPACPAESTSCNSKGFCVPPA